MHTHVVFCSACDHNVTLATRKADWWHIVLDHRPVQDVACLDRGRVCSGSLCPFCAEATDGIEPREASPSGASRPN